MSTTQNKKYPKPLGDLSIDIKRIDKSFDMIDEDITSLNKQIPKDIATLKQELTTEHDESIAMLGNLSLQNMERTQSIKIGVRV